MRRIRRVDQSPRLEVMPLIDVVFLLLTFFLFSLVVMVRAELLPVELVGLSEGGGKASPEARAVTIARDGGLYWNRERVTLEQLGTRLERLGRQPDPPRVYIAAEREGTGDRLPIMLRVVEKARSAGLEDLVVVGPPEG